MCACNCWDLQRFHNEYFVDTIQRTIVFPAEDILRRSVNLMNLDLDREVTAVNRSSRPVIVNGDLGSGRRLAVRRFQVGKRILDFVLHSIQEKYTIAISTRGLIYSLFILSSCMPTSPRTREKKVFEEDV